MFELPTAGQPIQVKIAYDDRVNRYRLTTRDVRHQAQSVVRRIESDQLLRVVPRGTHTHVYAHGSWYQPAVAITGTQAQQFMDLFTDPAPIGGVTSEKGIDDMQGGATHRAWPADSLFGRVDACLPRTVHRHSRRSRPRGVRRHAR